MVLAGPGGVVAGIVEAAARGNYGHVVDGGDQTSKMAFTISARSKSVAVL